MGKGGSTVQTTTQEIPGFIQDQVKQVFGEVENFTPSSAIVPEVAEFTPNQTSAQTLIKNLATGSPLAGSKTALDNILTGEFSVSAPLQTLLDDTLSKTVNNVTSQYSSAGRLGSDAFGDALGRGIGVAVAPTLAQQANIDAQRRDRLAAQIPTADIAGSQLQLRAAGQLPTLSALDLQRIGATGAAGELQRTADTRPIVADLQRIEQENLAEQARLNALLAAAGAGTVGIGQSQTSLAPPPSFASTLLGIGSIASGLGGSEGLLGFF